jgi:hypothetical protein
MVKINAEMKPEDGCMKCPFRQYVDSGDPVEPYDICGISGRDIPFDFNMDTPGKRMKDCKIID